MMLFSFFLFGASSVTFVCDYFTVVSCAAFSARSNGARVLCDREWSESLRASQAANLFNQLSELCDQIFNSITNDVIRCEYMDIYDKANLQNDSNSRILMHLNIRSFQ